MMLFFFMFQDILEQFFDILNDILSLLAPKNEPAILPKPKLPSLGR